MAFSLSGESAKAYHGSLELKGVMLAANITMTNTKQKQKTISMKLEIMSTFFNLPIIVQWLNIRVFLDNRNVKNLRIMVLWYTATEGWCTVNIVSWITCSRCGGARRRWGCLLCCNSDRGGWRFWSPENVFCSTIWHFQMFLNKVALKISNSGFFFWKCLFINLLLLADLVETLFI